MSARNTPSQKRTEVETLRPALMRDTEAAAYLARSASWIRGQRGLDLKARREGRAPTGPPWIVIGSSIFYRPADLDAWIALNAVDRGVVSFSNRGGPNGDTPANDDHDE